MAITNHERVGKALDLFRAGLAPYVDREVQRTIKEGTLSIPTLKTFLEDPMLVNKPITDYDASPLLKLMWDTWKEVFKPALGFGNRTLVSEIRDWRNKWAHQQNFTSDDTDRALDSMERLLTAVSAPQSEEVRRLKLELRRLVTEEQARSERRKTASLPLEGQPNTALKPWRDLITPHRDVASGRYQQAEFAADLYQVHIGEGSDEYRNPVEFFRRTFLTESLKRLLIGGLQRLNGQGGDPVVQLQTNFGGGKTHSMLALYHLFSGASATELLGVEELMREAGVERLQPARRVVLVGNKISPGNPSVKPDGTVVRTLWGELAWQLGGKEAFARVAADDAHATSPGDVLRELFNDHGPCVILIDEWVAYARQLHDQSDLPAGGFETQFSFAQALTESAKLARACLLVVSLPASDTASSPHAQADDEEVGGERGRAALARLRNVVARLESTWTPASAEEGFEIVRRRLFEPMLDPEHFKQRDVVARAFAELYQAQHQEFPPECRDSDYEKRLRAAYPIHPEVFDRLYKDWGSLAKFQRTRGVLRLMAAVIHSLWERGDRNPLILPATLPIDDNRVRDELTRYLTDTWKPIIESDVDGPQALPLRIDGEVPNLGKLSATRRVARTIYLGSAPLSTAANMGLEDRRVKLGCAMPGETVAVFGDALRRLAASATYLYQDGTRYWYSTQPTVAKLARDRADQLQREPDRVVMELEARLRRDTDQRGEFSRVHVQPNNGSEVPDDLDTRLVVLGPLQPYAKGKENLAEVAAKALLESRGNAPRQFRNTLVFLAPDQTRLQDLTEAVRKYLAWKSIVGEKVELNLTPNQVSQAETQLKTADTTVQARLPETYQWLLVPSQATPQTAAITWETLRLTGQEALAVRAGKKLRSEELLLPAMGGSRLRMEMDRVPLWRANGHHVPVAQLVQDFASYLYLPKLSRSSVISDAARGGISLLTWEQDSFAYADSFDDTAKPARYRGLRHNSDVLLTPDDKGLLIKPAVARAQIDAEVPPAPPPPVAPPPGLGEGTPPPFGSPSVAGTPTAPPPPTERRLHRFHGSVLLSPERVGRDAARIAEELIAHLAGQEGASVTVTLEISAHLPAGASASLVRTVTENATSLKFESKGFEQE
ncbi:MAG: hypothetical protein RL260_2163 [Pseudomonadota bacterium]